MTTLRINLIKKKESFVAGRKACIAMLSNVMARNSRGVERPKVFTSNRGILRLVNLQGQTGEMISG